MAFRPTVPDRVPLRAGRLRMLVVLAGLAVLCLLALRTPAFADEAVPDETGDAPVPRASADITRKVMINDMKLQVKNGNTWTDVPDGGSVPNWSYVRIYIDWEIPDMTGVNPGDTFTFTTDPQDHLLSGNFGPADLVDPGTSKVIGSYVVNGNRNPDGSMNDNMITIVTTLSEDGAQFPSLHNGFFTLEGYVQGAGNDIVFTVNGEALAPVDIVPEPSRPIPDTPLLKYGTQEAGQNQIRWVAHVNSDIVASAYADYAAGGSSQSEQRPNLLLTDELQGGQAITSDDVVVRMPIYATTNAGEAQSQQYASFVITSLFDKVDKSAADGMTQEEFANSVRGAATPTIGVGEPRGVRGIRRRSLGRRHKHAQRQEPVRRKRRGGCGVHPRPGRGLACAEGHRHEVLQRSGPERGRYHVVFGGDARRCFRGRPVREHRHAHLRRLLVVAGVGKRLFHGDIGRRGSTGRKSYIDEGGCGRCRHHAFGCRVQAGEDAA
ncbi:hypothetical protein [Gordonibacter pamelaeae]|uniref:hypothetical protein n=1 Tax=Gordonibacter pamelaeae TaxID=471189 RepID=UPI00242DAF1E|nr:hypothetical protein [Gordonibacter pamelaeae]